MTRRFRLTFLFSGVALLSLLMAGGIVSAAWPAALVPATPSLDLSAPGADGFDQLPPGLQARSMAALVAAGLVHPLARPTGPVAGLPPTRQSPLNPVTWGPPVNVSLYAIGTDGSNSPGAAMHPLDPLKALSGGVTGRTGARIEATTDQGSTWTRRASPNCANLGLGVPAWLGMNLNGGNSAIFVSLCSSSDGGALKLTRSTDAGASWAADNTTNIDAPGLFDDRPYVWTDQNPASPFYGRTYLTQANLDPGANGTYDSISVRYTTDTGTTWSPVNALVDATEFQQGLNHNEFPSLAIEPNGTIVAAWHRGKCCGGGTPFANVANKVAWAKSTDGGVTFPISGTAVTVPISQSISYNSSAPGGFRWSDAPNITADPVNGTLYAVWLQDRVPNLSTTAAVYLSRGTPDALTWTPPLIIDNSQPAKYQYMPWVSVSPDHAVHVTYGAAAPGGTNTQVAQYYVQSTDAGATWTAPFQLSSGVFTAGGYMGDYQANSVGGNTGGSGVIEALWTDTSSGEDRWGRFGTFLQGTPTPTVTGTPPTATPTGTPTATRTPSPSLTPTATPTCGGANLPWATVSPLPADLYGASATTDGTYLYTAGGFSVSNGLTLDLFARYDPPANTWITLLPMPQAAAFASAVYAPNVNTIFVFGGQDATTGTTYNVTRAYDLASGIWTLRTILPAGRASMASGYYNGKIYLVGGYVAGQPPGAQQQVWEYDPIADTFVTRAPLPAPVGNPGFGLLNGHLYVIGGSDGTIPPRTSTFDYDIAADTWSTRAPLPFAVTAPGSAALNGKIWLFGGGTPFTHLGLDAAGASAIRNPQSAISQAPALTTLTQVYDPATNTYSSGPSLQQARLLTAGVSLGHTLYAIAGYIGGISTSSVEATQQGFPCVTPSATPATPSATPTGTPAPPSRTPSGTPSPTACPLQFADVAPSDPFYPYIRCLACRQILSGYSTSPPCAAGQTPCYNGGANVTRGQVAKIVSNAAGYTDPIPSSQQTFSDVPGTNPFWVYIERLAEPDRQYISGYSTSPPCTTGVPCFLPFNNVTRGQMAKIDANAGGFFDAIPSTQQTFTDVPPSSPFWVYVERAALHGVISGYSASPPCPGAVPCFLPGNDLTRNQAAKVVAQTFNPGCATPAGRAAP